MGVREGGMRGAGRLVGITLHAARNHESRWTLALVAIGSVLAVLATTLTGRVPTIGRMRALWVPPWLCGFRRRTAARSRAAAFSTSCSLAHQRMAQGCTRSLLVLTPG